MKKSQIEIMGLIVIIILVVIGFFIYIVLSLNSDNNEPKQEFENDQLAQNFVTSLVKTDTACEYSVAELVKNCRLGKNISCSQPNACIYLNSTVQQILEKTLNIWGYAYLLEIQANDLIYTNKECSENSNKGTQGFELISLYPQAADVLVTLDICRR